MAIKAALAASLLLALVALASATTFTTTVTTTTDDENSQQCSQQVQGRRFSKCEYFLKQRGSPYTNEAEEEDEAFAITNPDQGSLHACCQELRQMDRQHCGCEAIRHAARKAQQSTSTGYGSSQSQQIYQRARTLPRRCGLRQQQCRFSLVFV